MTNRRNILRWLIAISVGVGSIPLSLLTVDFYFGLCSLLIVPAFASAVSLTLTASEERRPWWFGFAVTLGAFLPLCPVVEQWLSNGAIYLQQLSQRGVLSLSQRVIEPTLLLLQVICPFVAASLLGVAMATLSRYLANRRRPLELTNSDGRRWRLSVREMLIALAAISFLGAWITSQTRRWENLDQANQLAFLERFKASFSSEEVKLLAEPRIEEQERSRMREYGAFTFRGPGVNEYRIVAPIKRNDRPTWAVWAFTCNEEAHDMIYRYAYAEAPDEEQLPDFPFPAQRYVDITSNMVDGVPSTAGPSATVTSVTSPARVDRPLVLTASAPPGTVCELHLFPSDLLPAMPPQTPDKKGNLSWSWNVPAKMAGYRINYEVRCIKNRRSGQMLNTTRGSITLIASEAAK